MKENIYNFGVDLLKIFCHLRNFLVTRIPRYPIICRSGASGEHGEHAVRTPKVFPKNTQDKKLSKRCLDSISAQKLNLSIFPF